MRPQRNGQRSLLAITAVLLLFAVLGYWNANSAGRAADVAPQKYTEIVTDSQRLTARASPAFPALHSHTAVEAEIPSEHNKDAPPWVVHYGHEFWRQPKSPARGNTNESRTVQPAFSVGDVVERVSHAFVVDKAQPRVRAQGYTAQLTPDGLELQPHAPNQMNSVDEGLRVGLRTVAIRHGGQVVYGDWHAVRTWSVTGNTAQALLVPDSDVVEHYEARASGMELTWIFHRPLPGTGALVIESELTGLEIAASTESGHHFADPDGIARVRVSHARVVDASGKNWDLPLRVSDHRLIAAVPSSVLAEAEFPLAVDPMISPEFGIDTPVLMPNALGWKSSPSVASNGHDFLVLWLDGRTDPLLPLYVFGTRVGRDGQILDPVGFRVGEAFANAFASQTPGAASNGSDYVVILRSNRRLVSTVITADGKVNHPAIVSETAADGNIENKPLGSVGFAFNGEQFLAVWVDFSTDPPYYDLYAARLDRNGVRIGSAFPVCTAPGVQLAPEVTSDGQNFFLVWLDGRGGKYEIYGGAVSSAGLVKSLNGIKLSNGAISQTHPSVACNGDNYFAVWSSGELRGRRISLTGELIDAAPLLLNASGIVGATGITTMGRDYFVVWPNADNISGARVRADGTVLDPGGLPLASAPDGVFTPSVASNGEECLVTWLAYERTAFTLLDIGVRATRVSKDARVLDANGFSIAAGFNPQADPAVAFNGSEYLVVWEDYRNVPAGGMDIFGARVDRRGAVLDPNGLAVSVAEGSQRFPAVASNGRDFLVVWQDGVNQSGAGNIRATRVNADGAVRDRQGIAFSKGQMDEANPSVASDGSNYFVAWYGGRDVYGARVDSSGTVLDTGGLVIVPSALGAGSPVVAGNAGGFLVAWHNNSSRTACARKVGIDGKPIGDVLVVGSGGPVSVASDGRDYLVAWKSRRDILQWRGIRADGSLKDDTRFISDRDSPEGVMIPTLVAMADGYFLTWTENGTRLVGTRLTDDGQMLDKPPLLITEQRWFWSGPADLAFDQVDKLLVVSPVELLNHIRIAGKFVTRLDPILLRSGSVVLEWPAEPGASYRVQFKREIDSSAWTDLSDSIVATNKTGVFMDSAITNVPQRFYRIVRLP